MPKCLYCKKEFKYRYRMGEKFCSRECNVAFHSAKKRGVKHCVVCGKELPLKKRTYCSNACALTMKLKRQMDNNKDQYKKPKAEEKPKVAKKKKLSLVEVAKLAKEAGLTYGQYVAKHGLY